MSCREGADSPSRDLSGRTSGVLLVLLLEDPEMDAWTEATTLACSGGTYLGKGVEVTNQTGFALPIKVERVPDVSFPSLALFMGSNNLNVVVCY